MNKIGKLSVLLLATAILNVANADLIDDFEDGDITENPVWTVANDYGSSAVEADPLDPSNRALRITPGNPSASYILATSADARMQGFQYSMDFLLTGDYFGAFFQLGQIGFYGLNAGVFDYGTGNAQLVMAEGGWGGEVPPTHFYDEDSSILSEDMPLNEWLSLRVWQDISSGRVMGEVLDGAGVVLLENSFMPSYDLTQGVFDTLHVASDGNNNHAEYFDNITLTGGAPVPEPASVTLLGLGLVGIVLRQAKFHERRRP